MKIEEIVACGKLTMQQLRDLDLPSLRLLVANHLGFTIKPGDDCCWVVTSPNGSMNRHGNDCFWEIPDYCWSMTQAWQLVEHLQSAGIYLTIDTTRKGFNCWTRDYNDFQYGDFFEEKAEVSICRWFCYLMQGI